MSKTLVIILGETRAHKLTFSNFKENVIDRLQADLCLCIGIKPDYDIDNQFYKLAKYRFLYYETEDFGGAFDYAHKLLSGELKTTNSPEPLQWREFLKIRDQFLGGVKDEKNEHPGSGAILIFFRWFLLKNLIDNDLISKYDRFVITRSDFIYQLPHPKLEFMSENNIWIPDAEHYSGYTDRHVVLSKTNIEQYLNILNNLVTRSYEYFYKMMGKSDWNLEQLIKFHLEQNKVVNLVKEFPYIMYSIRPLNGSTRWATGTYSNKLGYYIKYEGEYNKSTTYKDKYNTSGLEIDDFYLEYFKSLDT